MARHLNIFISFLFLTFTTILAEENGVKNSADVEKLFKLKRQEQKDAVQRLLNMKQPDKQHKLLELIIKNIIDVLNKSRIKIESSGFIPGDLFPSEEGLREGLSSMIENTVFLGDLVLYLPDLTARFLKNTEWNNIFKWSLSFCREVPFLDKATKIALHLVAQELNLVERDPNYMNPYAKINQKKEVPKVETLEKQKRKKKAPKGPSLGGKRFQDEL